MQNYLHNSIFFIIFAGENVEQLPINFGGASKTANDFMPSPEVQAMIPKIQAYLATQPVERAYLFGSCARGDERPDSDIDLLFRR